MKRARYLFSDWKNVGDALRGRFVYLFLDYDGTLVPIAKTPPMAVIPGRTKELLRRLSGAANCKVAVVSGRALEDVSRRVGLKDIVYVGNHGFEISGPKLNFKSPVPLRYRRVLDGIKARLEKNILPIKGVFIEDKGFSLSVHYRLVNKDEIPAVKNEFYAAVFLHELKDSVRIRQGKMALEVRPPVDWDKGKSVLWLLGRRLFVMRNRKRRVVPVYIGDDATDEDAFESLKDRGLTVFVGKGRKTRARFYLKNTGEVEEFLRAVLEMMKQGAPCRTKR